MVLGAFNSSGCCLFKKFNTFDSCHSLLNVAMKADQDNGFWTEFSYMGGEVDDYLILCVVGLKLSAVKGPHIFFSGTTLIESVVTLYPKTFVSNLVGNPKDRFSCYVAQLVSNTYRKILYGTFIVSAHQKSCVTLLRHKKKYLFNNHQQICT